MSGFPGLDVGDTPSDSPSSPRLDRLSMRSDSQPDLTSGVDDKAREVVVALLASILQSEEDVRNSAASSLALLAEHRSLLVLTEWHSAFSKQKQLAMKAATPSTGRKVSGMQTPTVSSCAVLVQAMGPIMARIVSTGSLDAADVRHRAVLGQIMATLVEEMVSRTEVQVVAKDTLVSLAGAYMDKVMDVLLVQYQPNTNTVHTIVVSTLGNLARQHPHGSVPFTKAILSTTAHLMKGVKVSDTSLRIAISESAGHFCDALLDYMSNISEMTDTSVTLEHYGGEADSVYEQLFSSWLPAAREKETKLAILAAIACTTPLVSQTLVKDKSTQFITMFLGLYKKLSPSLGSSLEITLCLSQLLQRVTAVLPSLLEPVLDPVFNTMFQQVCYPPDYTKLESVKNHNEMLRCYDTMMKHFPAKLVSGLLTKIDSGEERIKIGALTVVKHLLNMSTESLGDRLGEIFSNISSRLSETNPAIQSVLAQIIVLLGHHGTVTGQMGRQCVEFIIRLCGATQGVEKSGVVTDSLGEMCSNILQLLTTSVPSVESVLWPHTMEYFFMLDTVGAVPAVARSLAHLANNNKEGIEWGQFQYCTSGTKLLARLIVLTSVPQEGGRGVHILRFLLKFAHNINRNLVEVWQARFPLLLHFLEQHKDSVELGQWQDWVLALITDSVQQVGSETWTVELVTSLVEQLALYSSDSEEKSFCLVLLGHVLTKVTNKQVVMDTLSSIFLVSLERKQGSVACAQAFGICASAHLGLVLAKLEILLNNNSSKRSTTMFFGLLRDKNGEENQTKVLSVILNCIGQAASKAQPEELGEGSIAMVERFLSPCLSDCKDSSLVRESVLTAVSDLAVSLQRVMEIDTSFQLTHHEELLQSAIFILQNSSLSLSTRQMALHCLTSLIKLPPNISQFTRCSLLKACFSTIFSSFLEHHSSKTEDYAVASQLEQQLTNMVDKLHILIRELLRQDMEQSTLDEIFTMLEPWLKLDQDLSRELSVNIFQGALDTYARGVKLGVNSPSNFTPGPYMIGAMIPRCCDPSKMVRRFAMECLQHLLRILALYEGLDTETVEQALMQLQEVNIRCNGENGSKLEIGCVSQALVSVLGERVQHQHILSLLDSLVESILDAQIGSVQGTIEVLRGLVLTRGSEVFQNIPGFVRKLHDKMGLMLIDETADMCTSVADIVSQFCVHNTRGVVGSLVHLVLPVDREARLIWQGLASDARLGGEVMDVLLEIITQDQDKQGSATTHQVMGATSAITVMLDTRKLEEVARVELGRVVSSLVMLLSRSLGSKYSQRGSIISLTKVDTMSVVIDPVTVTLEAMRALFSCVNCVVVASSLTYTDLHNYTQLVELLTKLVQAVSVHGPHHLPAIISGHIPYTAHTNPDCMRVASLAILQGCAEHKGSVDTALLSTTLATLLKSCGDGLPLARRLALQGVPALAVCSQVELETNCVSVMSALITGVEDEQCSAVSLTALKGLVSLLPHVPAHHLHPLTSSLALKVRPFFESSSDDHRAAAISIYSCLARCAEGDHKASYLDYAQSIIVPVLLHSTSAHLPTRQACLETLTSLAKVTEFQPLINSLASYNPTQGFATLVAKLVACKCRVLIEMYPTAVATAISYFKSKNAMLRCNVVSLLSEVLCYTQNTQQEQVGEELVAAVIQGMIGLLKDQDKEVRNLASMNLGRVVILSLKN